MMVTRNDGSVIAAMYASMEMPAPNLAATTRLLTRDRIVANPVDSVIRDTDFFRLDKEES